MMEHDVKAFASSTDYCVISTNNEEEKTLREKNPESGMEISMLGKGLALSQTSLFHVISGSKYVPSTRKFTMRHYVDPKTRRNRQLLICGYEDCGREFHKRCNFFDHLRTHTGEKPY